MKERKTIKTIRNLAIALGTFMLWGNIISLLLPTEEYGAVMKTVDFATVLFLLAIVITAVWGSIRESRNAGKKDEKEPE